MTKQSGQGPAILNNLAIALPSYQLMLSLGLDPNTFSAAFGHPDGASSFIVVATRALGLDARTLLGGWFADGLIRGASWDVETFETNGRVVQLYGQQAVYVTDGLVYWMTYFDVGRRLAGVQRPDRNYANSSSRRSTPSRRESGAYVNQLIRVPYRSNPKETAGRYPWRSRACSSVDRALGSGPKGRRFESCRARQSRL